MCRALPGHMRVRSLVASLLAFSLIAACGGSVLTSPGDAGSDTASLEGSAGYCCKPDPQPGCCMHAGGWSGGGSCSEICDGMPVPGPWWHLVKDSHGCETWTVSGSAGPLCGAPRRFDSGGVESSTSEGGNTVEDGGPTDSSSSLPPGAVPGPVKNVPAACSGDVYLVVPASDCPFLSCSSSAAYALCDGGTFSACDCDIPSGYTILVEGD